MSETATVTEPVIELPSSAPQIRVTAGVGSAGQKTWNLRRPVTLLGSKRPAHIVLHDRGVSVAHAVIINTGTDVLLFDLHTASGTMRGKDPVDLVALQDGDVVTLGESTIQIAIRVPPANPDDSGAGLEYLDPVLMASPVTLSLIHTDTQWKIQRAVALIGKLEQAAIRLDHSDVSTRHALLFRFGRQPAVFDLGGRDGVWVNGQKRDISVLADSDRLTVGPFGLQLQVEGAAGTVAEPPALEPKAQPNVKPVEPPTQKLPDPPKKAAAPVSMSAPAPPAPPVPGGPVEKVAPGSEKPTDPLQANIVEAWERLNQWRAQLRHDAASLAQQQTDLSARGAQLDARDAALRGQLHDITRFNEQLSQREIELAKRAAQIQEEADALGAARKEFMDNQAESQKRDEELHRREQAMSQRWSRMQATVCPHCQKPIGVGTA